MYVSTVAKLVLYLNASPLCPVWTHIVPVGFDYDRLIAPLVRDQLDVDRVVLLEGAVGSEANVEYSRNLAEKLEQDYRNQIGRASCRERV